MLHWPHISWACFLKCPSKDCPQTICKMLISLNDPVVTQIPPPRRSLSPSVLHSVSFHLSPGWLLPWEILIVALHQDLEGQHGACFIICFFFWSGWWVRCIEVVFPPRIMWPQQPCSLWGGESHHSRNPPHIPEGEVCWTGGEARVIPKSGTAERPRNVEPAPAVLGPSSAYVLVL